MNSDFWGNSRVASGVLTQKALNEAMQQIFTYGLIDLDHARALLFFNVWDHAIDSAVDVVFA